MRENTWISRILATMSPWLWKATNKYKANAWRRPATMQSCCGFLVKPRVSIKPESLRPVACFPRNGWRGCRSLRCGEPRPDFRQWRFSFLVCSFFHVILALCFGLRGAVACSPRNGRSVAVAHSTGVSHSLFSGSGVFRL